MNDLDEWNSDTQIFNLSRAFESFRVPENLC